MTYDPAATYRAAPGVSWSRLSPLARSPAAYRHALAHPVTPTPAMWLGTLTHLAVLEPERYAADVAVAPPAPHRTSTLGKAAHEGSAALAEALAAAKKLPDDDALRALAAYAEHVDRLAAGGAASATPDEDATARAIAAAVRAHPVAGLLLAEARCEVPMHWTDGGTPCKGLADAIVDGASEALAAALDVPPGTPVVVDLKTTRDAEPDRLPSEVARRRYHGQLAHYVAGLVATHPDAETWRALDVDPVAVLVFVESTAPHDVVVMRLSEHALHAGSVLRHRLLDRLRSCEASDDWPGAAPGVVVMDLPRWADEEEP